MIQHEFIRYEQALELKELGFDEGCFGYYSKDIRNGSIEFRDDKRIYRYTFEETIPAPNYSQCFRWFREKHKLEGLVERSKGWYKFTIYYYLSNSKGYVDYEIEIDTYEEAELACLKKLILIIKKK